MIKFFCPQFQIDLSHLPITLVEENARFQSTNLRNYSLPFSFNIDDETSKMLGFIDDEQSRKRTVKHLGKLQFLDRFENAIMYLYSTHKGKIQSKIDFGGGTMPLLETNLSDLPFASVNVQNIRVHAYQTVSKNWPETPYNFPRIIDLNFSANNSNYEKFLGCINNQEESGNFYGNTIVFEDNVPVAYNRNVLSPCVYVMEILKVGFESANLVMFGNFLNDLANRRLLVYTKKNLENFNEQNVNVFLNEFHLANYLPEMTFGTFLNKLKNWFNLEITYHKNIVTINYLERNFKNTEFKKAVHLENEDVKIEFNETLAYELMYDEANNLAVDHNGNQINTAGFEKNEIQTVNFDLTLLRQGTFEGVTTAEVLEDDADFKVLIYNGLQSGQNLSAESVYGRNFTLPQIYALFWKKWIHFRLNSDKFTDQYETDSDDIDINSGIWKYHNKHLIKKITRKITHINDQEIVNMTIDSETLF